MQHRVWEMQQRTLLLIDDDKDYLQGSARCFSDSNYTVLTAATCAEGVLAAQRHHPDCILLDIHMPDMKGCEVAFKIRSDAELRKMPIIIVSGDLQEELDSHYGYKADGFFYKGDHPARLLAMVESLLRRVDWERGVVDAGDIRLEGTSFQVFRDSKLVARLTREQFSLFSLLVEKSPAFVSEEEIAGQVFQLKECCDKFDAIRGLAQRLRANLGPQLGRRVKSKVAQGWIYVRPRSRHAK